jgi:hypothetical protein
MMTIQGRLARITIAVGALLLTMSAATPIFGKGSPGLTVRAVVVRGNEVAITVVNRTAETRIGIVASRVPTVRGETVVTAPFTAAAGQTVTVRIALPEPVLDGFPVGVVVDDGVPF